VGTLARLAVGKPCGYLPELHAASLMADTRVTLMLRLHLGSRRLQKTKTAVPARATPLRPDPPQCQTAWSRELPTAGYRPSPPAQLELTWPLGRAKSPQAMPGWDSGSGFSGFEWCREVMAEKWPVWIRAARSNRVACL